MSELKAVVLDRDGVINEESDEFVKTPEEGIASEGSLKAIAKLNNPEDVPTTTRHCAPRQTSIQSLFASL